MLAPLLLVGQDEAVLPGWEDVALMAPLLGQDEEEAPSPRQQLSSEDEVATMLPGGVGPRSYGWVRRRRTSCCPQQPAAQHSQPGCRRPYIRVVVHTYNAPRNWPAYAGRPRVPISAKEKRALTREKNFESVL